MQYFGLLIMTLFGFGIKELALRVLVAIGFGAVTTIGLYALYNQLETLFQAQLNGLPADIIAMLGLMKIDICFTMILSAASAKQVLRGWNKLTDTRSGRVWQAPGTGGTVPF